MVCSGGGKAGCASIVIGVVFIAIFLSLAGKACSGGENTREKCENTSNVCVSDNSDKDYSDGSFQNNHTTLSIITYTSLPSRGVESTTTYRNKSKDEIKKLQKKFKKYKKSIQKCDTAEELYQKALDDGFAAIKFFSLFDYKWHVVIANNNFLTNKTVLSDVNFPYWDVKFDLDFEKFNVAEKDGIVPSYELDSDYIVKNSEILYKYTKLDYPHPIEYVDRSAD